MAQDQLQTLKLEISKKATLQPYERMAFHRILGILKTENGMQILLKELTSASLIRESAVLILKDFEYKEVLNAFSELLKKQTSDTEKIYIFDYFERYGTPEVLPIITDYIEKNKSDEKKLPVLIKTFNVLRAIGKSTGGTSADILNYLRSTAHNKENSENIRSLAIIAASAFKEIVTPVQNMGKSFLEETLKEDTEEIICAAYNSMSILNDSLTERIKQDKSDEEEMFTYSPEKDDRAILDIRVLIGKMTSHFEEYSSRSKIALLNAMISSNHRELLIYLMKALTSNNPELIDMTLFLILSNVNKLFDPDKLFRNLISLSIDSPRGNQLIVDIFERYFKNLKDTRRNMLFSDKLHNYIVVTLETYFETYRKDFMVAEVMEKNFPENFQRIRRFILNKFTPDYKRKILNFLRSNDTSVLNSMLIEFGEIIPYISGTDREDFSYFLEMLYEKDIKSREISASRIDDINFEKRYLKDRIIRICNIIGKLNIESAASPLVIIYNYVKKYTDTDILDAASHTLSMLNYSYMLGELEVLLSTGDRPEQQKAVQFLSLFSDQRSLNIILDYLKQHTDVDSEIINKILNSLLRQDLFGNSTADSVLKEIIEKNNNPETKRLAILCLGKCAREADIQYLDSQFDFMKDNLPKEAVIEAIENIITNGMDVNIRPVKGTLAKYIKDPGIKIRIYSCYLLIKLGDKNALKSIMDMMTIKNKKIQRDIISTFGNLKSIEFAYFLISLLKDEYAISGDIVSMLSLLPDVELKEIDHFIINIFKKHESIGIGDNNPRAVEIKQTHINGLSEGNYSLLSVEIGDFIKRIQSFSVIESKLIYQQINNIIVSEIIKNNGIISYLTNGKILAYYENAQNASNTALIILHNFKGFNSSRLPDDRINIFIQIFSDTIKIINEEIINYDTVKIRHLNSLPVYNRIIVDEYNRNLIEKEFFTQSLPEMEFIRFVLIDKFHEMIGQINFQNLSSLLLENISREITEKQKREMELEAESKQNQRKQNKSQTGIAYAQALDDLGRMLKEDLNDINKYVQKRSTDRELLTNVGKMLSNVYKRFFVEKSKIFSEIE
jgi:HEAT repeat protein